MNTNLASESLCNWEDFGFLILQPPPFKYWDYRYVLSYLVYATLSNEPSASSMLGKYYQLSYILWAPGSLFLICHLSPSHSRWQKQRSCWTRAPSTLNSDKLPPKNIAHPSTTISLPMFSPEMIICLDNYHSFPAGFPTYNSYCSQNADWYL